MASFACTLPSHFSPQTIPSKTAGAELNPPFLSLTKKKGYVGALKRSSKVGPTVRRSTVTCWFRFGNKDAEGAGIYGSQSRDDFDRDDVEQLREQYDKMEALLNQDIHPVDILLILAASEGDKPKIEELLRAGAKYDVKDVDGRTTLDRANDEIREFIVGFKVAK